MSISSLIAVAVASLSAIAASNVVVAQPLYVGSGPNATIRKYSAGVSSVFATNSPPPLGRPLGLAFDSQGNLFASQAGNLYKYAADGSRVLFAGFGSLGLGAIAIDPNDNVYAAVPPPLGAVYGTIEKFTPDGVASLFATTQLRNLRGVACDAAGNVYVAGFSDKVIEKYTPAGVASVFANLASGISDPSGLAFDRHGNLFVADNDTVIKEISPAGVVSSFGPADSVNKFGIAVDDAGNVYASDTNQSYIVQYSPAGVETLVDDAPNLQHPGYLAIQAPEPAATAAVIGITLPLLLSRRRRQ